MGIEGLLQAFNSVSENKNLLDYKGKRAAIDGYSWIHKGKMACREDYNNNILDSKKYFDY